MGVSLATPFTLYIPNQSWKELAGLMDEIIDAAQYLLEKQSLHSIHHDWQSRLPGQVHVLKPFPVESKSTDDIPRVHSSEAKLRVTSYMGVLNGVSGCK